MTAHINASNRQGNRMIRRAFIVKRDGDPIFGRDYTTEEPINNLTIPASIRASIILLNSAQSTIPGSPYILKQNETIWVLCFYETFAVVLEGSADERIDWLKRRALSLGRYIVREFSRVVATWPGEISDITGFDEMIDRVVRLNLAIPVEKIIRQVETNVDRILTEYPVAYVGVFDAVGEMIGGNVPDDHIKIIKSEILGDSVKTSIDLVPIIFNVKGYEVHAIRVRTLTAVAASYQEEGKMAAVRAVGDLAQTIENAIV